MVAFVTQSFALRFEKKRTLFSPFQVPFQRRFFLALFFLALLKKKNRRSLTENPLIKRRKLRESKFVASFRAKVQWGKKKKLSFFFSH